ncbi:antA/AntB antirepressor family protein [Paeniglutamicibacter sp. R2-26]|uniref:antA/AntB antirepressor family protein n=1 Tax=Paeniglutamicibacter sp. R2-26 TaxID=3144417 RepID=UPI003EE56B8C
MSNVIELVASNALIPVTKQEGSISVSLRDLHQFLEVSKDFTNWAKQMFDYGFTEHEDYVEVFAQKGENPSGGRPARNWAISLDMAKELSMIQRTEKGKQARQYFIEVERRSKLQAPARALSPDEIVAQALQITTAKVRDLEAKIEQDASKVYYVDTMVAENDHHLFRTVASDLMVGEMELRWALVYTGWIYHELQKRRNSKGDIVNDHLWSEYAAKKPYFFRALNHQAPLFKGNVAYSLKLTTPGVAAVGRHIQKVIAEHGTLKAALPILEQRYNERRAS